MQWLLSEGQGRGSLKSEGDTGRRCCGRLGNDLISFVLYIKILLITAIISSLGHIYRQGTRGCCHNPGKDGGSDTAVTERSLQLKLLGTGRSLGIAGFLPRPQPVRTEKLSRGEEITHPPSVCTGTNTGLFNLGSLCYRNRFKRWRRVGAGCTLGLQ